MDEIDEELCRRGLQDCFTDDVEAMIERGRSKVSFLRNIQIEPIQNRLPEVIRPYVISTSPTNDFCWGLIIRVPGCVDIELIKDFWIGNHIGYRVVLSSLVARRFKDLEIALAYARDSFIA